MKILSRIGYPCGACTSFPSIIDLFIGSYDMNYCLRSRSENNKYIWEEKRLKVHMVNCKWVWKKENDGKEF